MGAVIVLALACVAIAVGVGVVRSAGAHTVPAPTSVAVEIAAAEVYVHVSGAVNSPGLYVLRADARVVDAVAAAGGLADGADLNAVNLARAVADGEQVVVPREGEQSTVSGVDAQGRVNINTADAATLDTLPGVGPAIAARILAWREEHGSFGSVDDLQAVSGIGPSLIEQLRDLATV